ncbi:MAG: type VI secretion system tip protein VgrG [Bacteroidales bacterium]|nr:type VI secretion system tip protein VgrG [Bacteroidales bacterium]
MSESRIIPTQGETDLATFTILIDGNAIGGDYGIDTIFVAKSVNKIPTARLTLFDGSVSQETFELSSGDMFVPGKEVEIKGGYHNDEDTIFKGIIIKQSIEAKRNKPSKIILDLKDESVKLTIGRKSKYFEEVTDSDIIEEIIGEYSLESDIEATDVNHAEMVQHHVTDWDFLVSRAEVNGKLVFVDDGSIKVCAPDMSAEPLVELAYGHNVIEFEAGMDARDQFTAVKGTSWDIANQSLVESEGEDPGLTEQGNFTATELADVIGLSEFQLQHSGKVADDELKAWADAQFLRSRLAKIQGKVIIQGYSDIKPGHIITLAGFGERFNGSAFVSSVAHNVTNQTNWTTDICFGLDKNWFANIYDNIGDKAAGGLLPSVHGLQIGIVTNIHEDPDGEERIRVRLPVIDNENDGVWARLTTFDAGSSRGMIYRPEIDDEVIVGFLNDDPRDPIILGSVYSSAHPAPLAADEENKAKGIVTKSEMKLVFDDDKVSFTIETPNGNKVILSEDEGSILIEDENGNKVELMSDGINIESAGDVNITASGDINLEGTNINVKASAQLKSEGSAGAEVSSSGQTVVKGSIVMLN